MAAVSADAVWMQEFFLTLHVLHSLCSWNYGTLNRSGQENFVFPNDRRRVAPAPNRRLPFNVLVSAPLDGQILLPGNPLAVWSPPLRPIGAAAGSWRCR